MKINKTVIEAARLKGKGKGVRILLINPPYTRILGYSQNSFNLGLGYIAATTESSDYNIAIYNSELDPSLSSQISYTYALETNSKILKSFYELNDDNIILNELKQVIENFKPTYIGISILSNKLKIALMLTDFIKTINKNICIIAGGHHPTMFPKEILEKKSIDFVVTGEGENVFPKLIKKLISKDNDFSNIANVFYWDKDKIKGYRTKNDFADIKTLPIPRREFLLGYQEMPSNWFSSIISSRGCPFNCAYCGSKNMLGSVIRSRDTKNIIDEVRKMNSELGVTYFWFVDDTFNVKRGFAEEIALKMGEMKEFVGWECNIRLDLTNEKQLEIFKENGCKYIWVGVESGSDRMLKLINKGITKETIRKKAKSLTNSKIKWAAYFMLGLPGETIEELQATLDFIYELKPTHAQVNIFNPLPGTKLFDYMKNNKLNDDFDWSLQSQTSISNLALSFEEASKYEAKISEIFQKVDEYNRGLY